MGIWDSEAPVFKKDENTVVVDVPVEETTAGGFKGLPVRVGGDRIWLLKDGKRAWITSKEVYEKLGFKFGDEKEIDEATLMALPEGSPLRGEA